MGTKTDLKISQVLMFSCYEIADVVGTKTPSDFKISPLLTVTIVIAIVLFHTSLSHKHNDT